MSHPTHPAGHSPATQRPWSMPVYPGALEEACAEIDAAYATGQVDYVDRIGLEVERGDQRRTLAPEHDLAGFAPHIGDHILCPALGGVYAGERWTVLRVVQGYPGRWAFRA